MRNDNLEESDSWRWYLEEERQSLCCWKIVDVDEGGQGQVEVVQLYGIGVHGQPRR
ncbi:hypothetical protein PM082_016574 [Marasmius tenuissimus]|nr:hypothetical protein PM082_016574 [Marasmius tenuissimus]